MLLTIVADWQWGHLMAFDMVKVNVSDCVHSSTCYVNSTPYSETNNICFS